MFNPFLPGLDARGCAGDGGVVSVNGSPVLGPSAGGTPHLGGPPWLNAVQIVAQLYPPAQLVAVRYDGGSPRVIRPGGVNEVIAGGDRILVVTVEGQSLLLDGQGAVLADLTGKVAPLAAGPDGTIAYKRWNRDGLFICPPDRIPNSDIDWCLVADVVKVEDVQVFDAERIVWREGRTIHAQGLQAPTVMLPGDFGWMRVQRDGLGRWWLLYQRYGLGVVLHPFDSLVGYWWPTLDAFRPDVCFTALRPQVAWSVRQGDQPDAWRREYLDEATIGPLSVPSVPVAVAAIARPVWLGWFTWGPTDAPGNCVLPVDGNMFVRSTDATVLAQYVAAELDGTAEGLDRAVATAKSVHPGLPVIPYWPRTFQKAKRVPAGTEDVGVVAYRELGEPLDWFEIRVRAAVALCKRAWLIAQGYTANPGNDPDLGALVPVYARIARDCPNVVGILVFSAGAKDTHQGWESHAEVHAAWRQVFAGIPSAPAVPRPAPSPVPSPQEPEMIAYGFPVSGFAPGDLEPNPDGTVSVKKPNGKYLCVTPTGALEERESGGGAWESFRKGKASLIAERDGGPKGPQVFVLPLAE
jgi:hypothetical protein